MMWVWQSAYPYVTVELWLLDCKACVYCPVSCLALYSDGCIGCTCYGLVGGQHTITSSQFHIDIAILSLLIYSY